MPDERYNSALSGPQVDVALQDMANHTSERYAKGTVNGTAITSGVGYHDNAKYYAESALDSANRAESAVPVSTNNAVLWNVAQTLTESNKAQARENIGATTETYVNGKLSNRNMLDNPFFQINQRGFTSKDLPLTSLEYTVDRWLGRAVKVTVNSDKSITVKSLSGGNAPLFSTRIEGQPYNGKTVTFSFIDGNNVLHSKTFTIQTNAQYRTSLQSDLGFNWDLIVWTTDSNYTGLQFYSNTNNANETFTIKCAKLELGTVSTLANDVAPDYGSELEKCQRYYYEFNNNIFPWTFLGIGSVVTSTRIECMFFLPTTMRYAGNSISKYKVTPSDISNIRLRVESTLYTPTAVSLDQALIGSTAIGVLIFTVSEVPVGKPAICFTQNYAKLSISADL